MTESQFVMRWVGSYLANDPLAGMTPETFATLPIGNDVIQNLLDGASNAGIQIPDDQKTRAIIAETIRRATAWGAWGPRGLYTVAGMHDWTVRQATSHFTDAARLLRSR